MKWARAVANEDLGAARERADAGMAELLKGPATAPSKHATELLGRAARVRMHGVTRPTSPRYLISNVLKWRHTHFVVDRFGAVYIPDAETHAQFVSYLQLFGYEYAEVSHNKPMVQDLSTILLQEFAKAFYACAFTMEAFAYNFPEASRDLERYVKALLSNRRSTVRKLHSKVWPEIVAWAKTQPAGRLAPCVRQHRFQALQVSIVVTKTAFFQKHRVFKTPDSFVAIFGSRHKSADASASSPMRRR